VSGCSLSSWSRRERGSRDQSHFVPIFHGCGWGFLSARQAHLLSSAARTESHRARSFAQLGGLGEIVVPRLSSSPTTRSIGLAVAVSMINRHVSGLFGGKRKPGKARPPPACLGRARRDPAWIFDLGAERLAAVAKVNVKAVHLQIVADHVGGRPASSSTTKMFCCWVIPQSASSRSGNCDRKHRPARRIRTFHEERPL